MKWFRFYSEAMHDPKVQQLRPELFKFWVNCLCLANDQADRGTLPPIDQIAIAFRMKRPVVLRFCTNLVEAKLIHPRPLTNVPEASLKLHWRLTEASVKLQWRLTDGFVIHQWNSRQPSSDSSAERTKRYRERTCETSSKDDVTVTSRYRDGFVTPRARGEGDSEGDSDSPPLRGERIPPPREDDPKEFGIRPSLRTGLNLDMLNEAIAVLKGDLRTEHLALELGRQHSTAANLNVDGWRWLRAANKIQGAAYTDAQRRNWSYFAAIASRLGEDEREERKVPTPPKRESAYQRKEREMAESMQRKMASLAREAERNGDR